MDEAAVEDVAVESVWALQRHFEDRVSAYPELADTSYGEIAHRAFMVPPRPFTITTKVGPKSGTRQTVGLAFRTEMDPDRVVVSRAGAGLVQGKPLISVALNGRLTPRQLAAASRKGTESVLYRELLPILRHEVTHLSDPGLHLERGAIYPAGAPRGDTEGARGYYNAPAEVRAFLQEIVEEARAFTREHWRVIRQKDLVHRAIDASPTYNRIAWRFTPETDRKILRAVASAVEDERSKQQLVRRDNPSPLSGMTREQLERLDFDVLSREAFGIASGDVVDLPVGKITIRWKQDLLNAKDDMARLVLTHPAPEVGVRGAPAGTASSPRAWAEAVLRGAPPVDVDLIKGGKYLLQDGHHRYLAAKFLKRPLRAVVQVSTNPITAILARAQEPKGRARNPTQPQREIKGSQVRTAMKKPGVSHVMRATILEIVRLAEMRARDRFGSPDAVLRAVLGKVLPYAAHSAGPPAKALQEEVRRALIAADTAVRVLAPMLLDGIGMSDDAERLRTLPDLADQSTDPLASLRMLRSGSTDPLAQAYDNLVVIVPEVARFGELHVPMNDARRVGFRAIQSANWGLVSAMRALHESQRESQRRGAGLSARKHAAEAGFHAVETAFLMLSMSSAPPLPQRTVPIEPSAILEALQTMLFRMACLDDRCRLHPDCVEHPELVGRGCFDLEVAPWLVKAKGRP
jgi:hypothetical protein